MKTQVENLPVESLPFASNERAIVIQISTDANLTDYVAKEIASQIEHLISENGADVVESKICKGSTFWEIIAQLKDQHPMITATLGGAGAFIAKFFGQKALDRIWRVFSSTQRAQGERLLQASTTETTNNSNPLVAQQLNVDTDEAVTANIESGESRNEQDALSEKISSILAPYIEGANRVTYTVAIERSTEQDKLIFRREINLVTGETEDMINHVYKNPKLPERR